MFLTINRFPDFYSSRTNVPEVCSSVRTIAG